MKSILFLYLITFKCTIFKTFETLILTGKQNSLTGSLITGSWGPFLERPGNVTGRKSYFEINVSRNVGCVLTSNEAHFVSLANNFAVPFSKLLKLPSLMENKTA